MTGVRSDAPSQEANAKGSVPQAPPTAGATRASLARIEPFLSPISDSAPCGKDERYHEDYMFVANQAKQLGGLTQSKIDWDEIRDKSSKLLERSTKDLMLASCLTLALEASGGWSGAADGLTLICELMDRYWQEVHPLPRSPTNLKRRVSPLAWLNLRLKSMLVLQTSKGQANHSDLGSLYDALTRYQETCAKYFGSQAPAVADLLSVTLELLPEDRNQAAADETPGKKSSPQAASPSVKENTTPRNEPAPTLPPSPPQDAHAQQRLENIQRFLNPIHASSPCGESLRYDPDFMEAQNESRKVSNQLKEQKLDWEMVREKSEALLESKTKDLNLACFLTLANYDQQGLEGLAEGFLLITELLERFWEDLHPLPRSATNYKPRSSPLSWISQQITKRLEVHEVTRADKIAVAEIKEIFERYANVCRARFEYHPPVTQELVQKAIVLDAAIQAQTPAEPKPKPAPTAQEKKTREPAKESSAPTPAPAPCVVVAPETQAVREAPADLSQATNYLGDIGDTLAKLASDIRRADPQSPLAYRLHRQAMWLHIVAPPPCSSGNKTMIPPLADATRKQLDAMLTHGRWDALLDEAESRLGKHRFCLDLHRYVSSALKGLGNAAAADTAVKAELAALLTRMPSLLELHASNGAPLADPDTVRWIEQEVNPKIQGTRPAPAQHNTSLADLDDLIQSKSPVEILEGMQAKLDSASDQLTYIQLALGGAQRLGKIPGLPLLLAQLAYRRLRPPGSAAAIHRALEAECLQLLLKLRTSLPKNKVPVLNDPEIAHLAIQLGENRLSDALEYFSA